MAACRRNAGNLTDTFSVCNAATTSQMMKELCSAVQCSVCEQRLDAICWSIELPQSANPNEFHVQTQPICDVAHCTTLQTCVPVVMTVSMSGCERVWW